MATMADIRRRTLNIYCLTKKRKMCAHLWDRNLFFIIIFFLIYLFIFFLLLLMLNPNDGRLGGPKRQFSRIRNVIKPMISLSSGCSNSLTHVHLSGFTRPHGSNQKYRSSSAIIVSSQVHRSLATKGLKQLTFLFLRGNVPTIKNVNEPKPEKGSLFFAFN